MQSPETSAHFLFFSFCLTQTHTHAQPLTWKRPKCFFPKCRFSLRLELRRVLLPLIGYSNWSCWFWLEVVLSNVSEVFLSTSRINLKTQDSHVKAALVTWVKGVVYHPCPGPELKARLSFLFSCFPFKCLQCDGMHCCLGARDGGAIWLCACVCLAPLIWPFLTGSL